jgi:hypothetical protein
MRQNVPSKFWAYRIIIRGLRVKEEIAYCIPIYISNIYILNPFIIQNIQYFMLVYELPMDWVMCRYCHE